MLVGVGVCGCGGASFRLLTITTPPTDSRCWCYVDFDVLVIFDVIDVVLDFVFIVFNAVRYDEYPCAEFVCLCMCVYLPLCLVAVVSLSVSPRFFIFSFA